MSVESWCEHWSIKINEDKTGHPFLPTTQTGVGPSCIEMTEHSLHKQCEIWRIHIQTSTIKAVQRFIRLYSLLKHEHLSTNLYKALIRSIMTYACPTSEFVADSHLLILQHQQKKALCATGNFPRHGNQAYNCSDA